MCLESSRKKQVFSEFHRILTPGGTLVLSDIYLPSEAGQETNNGLPQQQLAVSGAVPKGQIKTMLLCSDYAPDVLRKRIEKNYGCETFLHYGATESGLGGGVECSVHCGTHIRESELLIEIIDPETGKQLPDGEEGEVVLTTLGREAMPLIRYRTGDIASLDRSQCLCGGVTARLCNIYGRRNSCVMSDGFVLCSQDLDDIFFQVSGFRFQDC